MLEVKQDDRPDSAVCVASLEAIEEKCLVAGRVDIEDCEANVEVNVIARTGQYRRPSLKATGDMLSACIAVKG